MINDVEYDESIWLKLSCRGRDKTMYVGCIYKLFTYLKHYRNFFITSAKRLSKVYCSENNNSLNTIHHVW